MNNQDHKTNITISLCKIQTGSKILHNMQTSVADPEIFGRGVQILLSMIKLFCS